MGTEENKALIRRWVQGGWNEGNLDLVDELYTEDYDNGHWLPDGLPPGRDGLKAFVAMYRNAFADFSMRIEDMVAEGDKVVWRFAGGGTHTGEIFGIPPTGRVGNAGGIVIARFEDGRYAEDWVQ